MIALVCSALRRCFAATLPLAVLLALASCAPPQSRQPGPSAQAPAAAAPPAHPAAPASLAARSVPAPPIPAPPPTIPAPHIEVTSPPPAPVGSAAPSLRSDGGPQVVLTPPPGVKPRITVGLLLPLSGPEAALGHALMDAAALAVFEVADNAFVLVPRDTKGTPDGAREAAIAALEAGAKLLLGPVFAPDVAAVTPLARAANVAVIAFSNDRTVAGSGTYVLGLPPMQPIARVVGYAAAHGLMRFAALVPDGNFGRRVAEDISSAAARAGGVVTRVESYRAGQQAMTEAVRRLASYETRHAAMERQRAELEASSDEVSRQALRRLEGAETTGGLGFDAVLLPETGRSLEALAPLLPYYDVDTRRIRVLGIGDWRDRALIREPALNGAWVAGPSPEARAAFERRFQAAFGRPPHPLASLAYDATALAAVLASGDKGADFSTAALTARNGFAGSTGIFRLNADGSVDRGLAVMEVHPDGLKVIAPDPDVFPDAGS
jgi:ABC-type branched-subunit amino acid transport system substrate-binding protein